jgi:hypothetical protein
MVCSERVGVEPIERDVTGECHMDFAKLDWRPDIDQFDRLSGLFEFEQLTGGDGGNGHDGLLSTGATNI